MSKYLVQSLPDLGHRYASRNSGLGAGQGSQAFKMGAAASEVKISHLELGVEPSLPLLYMMSCIAVYLHLSDTFCSFNAGVPNPQAMACQDPGHTAGR